MGPWRIQSNGGPLSCVDGVCLSSWSGSLLWSLLKTSSLTVCRCPRQHMQSRQPASGNFCMICHFICFLFLFIKQLCSMSNRRNGSISNSVALFISSLQQSFDQSLWFPTSNRIALTTKERSTCIEDISVTHGIAYECVQAAFYTIHTISLRTWCIWTPFPVEDFYIQGIHILQFVQLLSSHAHVGGGGETSCWTAACKDVVRSLGPFGIVPNLVSLSPFFRLFSDLRR